MINQTKAETQSKNLKIWLLENDKSYHWIADILGVGSKRGNQIVNKGICTPEQRTTLEAAKVPSAALPLESRGKTGPLPTNEVRI
ncbi:hypothetical protein [Maridesulfovibrio ferrireducens]|uniref:hypothetical protein n=1 Tax=Maridesulfovibrio ferrireducens TaxID=246191 RepID=UPI001A2F9884|nr:hypothetical protein [Maridesulfovibrio ferrireducens]MBI9112228.1 hypothetical protein [Maridesulfovibrio ferrireducens]